MQNVDKNISKDDLINQLIESKDQLALLKDEKKLLESNLENLKSLTETINEVFWIFDWKSRKLVYVSPGYKKVYGGDPKELYNNPKAWISYIHPEDKDFVVSSYYEKVETGNYDIEFRVIRKDGKIHWVRDRAFAIKNEFQEVTRIFGLTEFITDRKEAQFALNEVKKDLENIIDSIPIGTIILNNDLKIQYFNQNALDLLRISKSSIKRLTAIDFIHPDFRAKLIEYHNKRKNGFEVPDSHELKVVRYDGSWFWASIKLNDINYNGEQCRILTIDDVSNLKSFETSLKFYNDFNQEILEANSLATLVIDRDHKIIGFNNLANELFSKINKIALSEFTDLRLYFTKKNYALINEKILEAEEHNKSIIELLPISLKSQKIWLSIKFKKLRNSEKSIGFVVSFEDVSDTITNKEDYEKNRAYFASLVNSKDHLSVFALNRDYEYIDFNEAHKKTMKQIWDVDIEISKSILDYMSIKKDRQSAKNNFDRALSGEDFSVVEEFGNKNIKKIFWENKYSPIIVNNKIIGVSVFVYDVSSHYESLELLENKVEELEAKNKSKDKFVSIIAHDLKAPMTGFIGLTKILKSEIEEVNPELLSIAESISENAQSMFELLENLLDWTRSNTGQKLLTPDNINLHLITQGIFSLFDNNSKFKNIELRNSIAMDIYAFADANTVTSVIRNLISNSLKFTSEGYIEVSAVEKNNEIVVSIEDTGIGMNNQIREKLLGSGIYSSSGTNNEKGTGLGLQLCREFIEKNGGTLKIESKVGKGSTFSFNLPKSS